MKTSKSRPRRKKIKKVRDIRAEVDAKFASCDPCPIHGGSCRCTP